MRRLLFLFILILSVSKSFATHLIGGEMRYEYIGPGAAANSKKYKIRLLLLRGLGGAQFISQYVVGVFNNDNNQKVKGTADNSNWAAIEDFSTPISVPINVSPCITGYNPVNYTYKTYSFTIELPYNNGGYTVAFQTYSRQNSVNVFSGPDTDGQGANYTCIIPGNNFLPFSENDSSPSYNLPLTVICENSSFIFDFSATDVDGDSLVYNFCDAYNGGAADRADFRDPASPSYGSVSYTAPYTGNSPLGSQSTINTKTGIISGIAPSAGNYVICVCASVFRKGIFIGIHRKDIIVTVNSCFKLSANPTFSPIDCTDFTVSFTEESTGNPNSYSWDFGDPTTGALNTSSQSNPSHLFSDTGVYNVKLIVADASGQCVDSVVKPIKVYPGFRPGFEVFGICANTSIHFNDTTFARYGTVNSWNWNFGDPSSPSNTSTIKLPTHVFTKAGTYTISLTVGTTKGCSEVISKLLQVLDKPPLTVIPKDTLICTIDTLQLNAVGTGTFIWSPNYMISNTSSATPLVSPDVTTTYHVQLTDPFGCVGSDSVKINVVDHVTQFAPKDTTICQGDAIVLKLVSDALYYAWTPKDGSISDTSVRTPTVRPLTTTTYYVTGSISNKCFAQNNTTIKVVAYPAANAGPDIPLCFGNSTQLHATGGVYYNWSPALYLSATNIPDPKVLFPRTGVRYIVAVRDTLGCPKTVRDTVYVNVITIHADAGPSDTSVVLGQPLQLGATGGTNYVWTPNTWLSDNHIYDPISLPKDNIKYTVRVSDVNGCFADDTILVHLYNLDAGLYVPNAFTPNGDGKNDVFKPIELGLKTLDLFRIYNRWGELVYSTTDINKGWDGSYKGRGQDQDNYVWYAEGTDYRGVKVKKKGNVILIRQ